MSSGSILLLIGVLMVPLMWGVAVFNRFVTLCNRYQNAYAQIDVQLKRRYDLIPNLVAATRAYLAQPLSRLMALVEQYPELRADDTVHRLTEELGAANVLRATASAQERQPVAVAL